MNKVALVFHQTTDAPQIFLFDEGSHEHELCRLANGYVANIDYGDDVNPNQEIAFDSLNETVMPANEYKYFIENENIVAIYSIGFFEG